MPPEESKPVEPVVDETNAKLKGKQAEAESESEDDDDQQQQHEDTSATGAPAAGSKKKKSKRKKVKQALTGKSGDPEADLKKAMEGLTPQQLKELLALNPSLAQEVSAASGSANPSADQAAQLLKNMSLQDIMTGLAAGGKNAKDMASYKFWQTQPVPKFGEDEKMEEGPLRIQTVEDVPKEPAPLVAGFEWSEMDLTSEEEIKEVFELLNGHYVEDDEASFRFNYTPSVLRWSAESPFLP